MGVVSIKRAGAPSQERRERMEAYLEWLLTPSSERVPPSKNKYAAQEGITTQSLRNYARDPWFQAELAKRGRAINKVEKAGDVVDRLFQLATDRSGDVSASAQVSAAKVFLDYVDRSVQEFTSQDLQDMSLDELREVIDDLERKMLD